MKKRFGATTFKHHFIDLLRKLHPARLNPINQFKVWQINRYIKSRQRGKSRKGALLRAGISADRLARRLDMMLRSALPFVGSFALFSNEPSPLDQAGLLIKTIGDLSPELSPSLRQQFIAQMKNLQDHNWGGIRRPASAALVALEA